MNFRKKNKGFTLVELTLVLFLILGTLTGIYSIYAKVSSSMRINEAIAFIQGFRDEIETVQRVDEMSQIQYWKKNISKYKNRVISKNLSFGDSYMYSDQGTIYLDYYHKDINECINYTSRLTLIFPVDIDANRLNSVGFNVLITFDNGQIMTDRSISYIIASCQKKTRVKLTVRFKWK